MAQVIKIEIPVTVLDETDALSGIISKLQELDKVAKTVSKTMERTGRVSAFGLDKTDELSRTTSKLQELDRTAKSVSKTMERTGRMPAFEKAYQKANALSGTTSKLLEMEKAAKSVSKSLGDAGKMSAFEKVYQKVMKPMADWGRKRYKSVMEVKDAATPVLSKIKSTAKGIAGKAWGITLKAKDLATAPIRGVLNLLKNPILQAGAVLGVGIGFKDTVDTYKNFEAAMSQVKALSGASGAEFTQLTEKAKEMGASTKFTATQSAEAFNYMAMAGWKTRDMLDGIGGIMSLAAASNEDLGTTSDIVTDALTAFGMKASDSGHFADVLAQAASNANTDVGMMGETFKYVGTMAGALGYSIEDVSLAAGLMANTGLKAGMAGTSLNAIFTRLSTNTDGAADAIRDLGVEFFNADGSARKWSTVMSELRTATSNYSKEQKTNLANTVAGMEAQKGLLAILNATEEDYNKIAEAVNNADGASQRMADTMQDNLAGAMTRLQSAADGVKLSLGERLKPYLMDLTEWLTEQMPAIEDGLMRFMDYVDSKVASFKNKISEFTSTAEWQDADFFGKVKIAWDEIIADPFAEWWEGSGRIKLAGVAKDIGTGLGTGISAGILTLLGIDVSSTVDDAKMIGKQFADGFSEGFQGVDFGEIFGTAMSGMVGMASNAAKFIPGGESPDITSALSAMALFKMAAPIFSIGSGAFKIGKGIYDSATGGLLRSIIGSTGNAMVGGSGLLGKFADVGYGLTGGSAMAGAMSGGTAALAGGASIAGGLVGAGTVLSAGKNVYTAVTTDDNNERAANISSAGLKLTGVGAGAALGASIGSAFFGIGAVPGALIGAGLGGLAGLFGGGMVEDNYQKQAEAAEILGEKSKYALEGAKFDTEELKEAFEDTEVSVEEFASMMQKATSDKIRDSFGDIKLTAKEIKELASGIVLGDQMESMTGFAQATATAETSLKNMSGAVSSMKKLNWKASLGMEFDDVDIQEYTSSIDSLLSNASTYLEDKHYEAKAAIDLLVEPGNETDMSTGLNSMYADMQSQIESLGGELSAKVNVALEDGVISLNEQAEIESLQSQITAITDQITEAETEASFQSLKIKYSGAALDSDSFANMVSEIQSEVQEVAQSYDDALDVSLTNLNLQLQSGAISQDQFDSQLQALTEGYQAKITDLSVRIESFELQSIQDAFGSELDGILPNLEGSVAERLGQAMHSAMAAGVDVEGWDVSTASKWLDLDGLSAETQSAVTELMSQVAASLPEQMTSALEGSKENLSEIANSVIESSFQDIDMSGTSDMLMTNLTESIGSMDMSAAVATINSKFGEAVAATDVIDMSGVAEGMTEGLNSAIQGMDYGSVTSAVGGGISDAILATIGEIQGAISSLYSQVGAAINSAFAAGFQTTTTVTITADYQLANPTATLSFSGGGSGTATVSGSISSHAGGGYVSGKQLSWLAEEGYGEFVIPTAPGRRARALELYEQAGLMLGVGAHAAGGFIGSVYAPFSGKNATGINYINEATKYAPVGGNEAIGDGYNESPGYYYVPESNGQNVDSNNKAPVQVNVNLSPEFHISGGDAQSEEDIMRILRKHMKEMADELGGAIAANLEEVYSNMPLKVGVC